MLQGGRGTTDKGHGRVWGALAVFRPHWVCPLSQHVCFPRLQCSGSRLLFRERALSCMHFSGPSLSGSGFQVLQKGTDSAGPAFCAFLIRAAQAARSLTSTLSPGAVCRIPSVIPASVSTCWSGVPCVSSRKLISGCDPPGKCQPSRISGSLWLETGSLFAIW